MFFQIFPKRRSRYQSSHLKSSLDLTNIMSQAIVLYIKKNQGSNFKTIILIKLYLPLVGSNQVVDIAGNLVAYWLVVDTGIDYASLAGKSNYIVAERIRNIAIMSGKSDGSTLGIHSI